MLQAKTKEQREHINALFMNPNIHADEEYDGLVIGEDWISYAQMEAIVDYLRSINKPSYGESIVLLICLLDSFTNLTEQQRVLITQRLVTVLQVG